MPDHFHVVHIHYTLKRSLNMTNNTASAALRGLCPPPFYDASKFELGGCEYTTLRHCKRMLIPPVVEGRFCAPVEQIKKGLYCCLPCPMTDYLYPQGTRIKQSRADGHANFSSDFNTYYKVAEALNVVGLVLLVFLLISFVLLPAEKTRRHYLSYCLIIAAIFMAVSETSQVLLERI